MFAADKGHSDIVRAFLEASVASAQTLRSALELANFHGHHEVVLGSAQNGGIPTFPE